MQPSPSPEASAEPAAAEPVLEVIDSLVPEALHQAAWQVCCGKRWYFGHASNEGDGSRFWKMDLDGDAVFNSIWDHVRPRCEALAGGPLCVIRQYANGHTYGLGGQPHLDDHQPGTFTLLYYPNPEWKDGWDGETVYYDEHGEIALAIRLRPNRAVFFDSRILHAGRAPSRWCPALRVTVAYKLQVTNAPGPVRVAAPKTEAPQAALSEAPQAALSEAASCTELAERCDGASRVYRLRVPAELVDQAVSARLAELGEALRLPGFRPGKIPVPVLRQRYGVRARQDALNRFVAGATEKMLPRGCVVGSVELKAGAESGCLEFDAAATYLADLPDADLVSCTIEQLSAAPETLQQAGLGAEQAATLFRQHLKLQVLDHLDAAYPMPVLPLLVQPEFAAIWRTAEAQSQIPADTLERQQMEAEYRAIAERRVRLGAIVAELGRRHNIGAKDSAELEDKVVELLAGQAQFRERQASAEELRGLADES